MRWSFEKPGGLKTLKYIYQIISGDHLSKHEICLMWSRSLEINQTTLAGKCLLNLITIWVLYSL